jgi:hypothetical protein
VLVDPETSSVQGRQVLFAGKFNKKTNLVTLFFSRLSLSQMSSAKNSMEAVLNIGRFGSLINMMKGKGVKI